jgi:hypothetical protein
MPALRFDRPAASRRADPVKRLLLALAFHWQLRLRWLCFSLPMQATAALQARARKKDFPLTTFNDFGLNSVDVLVGTPSRLLDLVKSNALRLGEGR